MRLTTPRILRTGLSTPLSLSSQLVTASRLLPPRSGLERSDFVLWHVSTVFECPLYGACWGKPEIETEPKWRNVQLLTISIPVSFAEDAERR